MSGTWQTLTAPSPPANAGTMLLLTDGRVLCHDEPNSGAVSGSNRWYTLTPNSSGDYQAGTWTQVANGPNSPLYFACSVLRDGRVFIAGGEYNGTSAAVELNAAEIYDPVANSWTTIGTPAGWTQIGDAPSCVLNDGRVLLGNINNKQCAIYDPIANSWTAGPTKDDTRCTEETWVLLADQTVLCLECDRQPRAEKYVMAANQWVSAGNTPVTLVDTNSDEIGSALALPDGRVFCIGATANTALYTPPMIANQAGTWATGPSFPVVVKGLVTGAKDAPACLLPNGRVLCVVAPYNPTAGTWGNPLYLYEYDPVANTLTQVSSPANGAGSPFSSRLILLPTGQVLHTNGSSSVAIYTPDGAPDPVWKPSITSVPTALLPGHTYTLHGRQINGLSQAVIYGDEGAMATNYPIVRLTDTSGNVHYCRTHDHSTMGIQTGAVIHTTQFTVPASVPYGSFKLCVIANGISSDCVSVAVTHKIWKELKLEIKEHKELLKREHDALKLVFEDLTKINEGDWRERFGEQGWGEVIKELVSRSDEIEGELRAFIDKKARPEVGFTPSPVPSTGPAPREPKSEGEEKKATKAKKKGNK
jgi:Kelch motif protein